MDQRCNTEHQAGKIKSDSPTLKPLNTLWSMWSFCDLSVQDVAVKFVFFLSSRPYLFVFICTLKWQLMLMSCQINGKKSQETKCLKPLLFLHCSFCHIPVYSLYAVRLTAFRLWFHIQTWQWTFSTFSSNWVQREHFGRFKPLFLQVNFKAMYISNALKL